MNSKAIPQQNPTTEHSVSVNPSPGADPLDNNTLAAMIAAENAALTLPQYLTGLPIITR